MRCPNCNTTFPDTWVICPQCNLKLTPFSTSQLTTPTEPATRPETSRLRVDLTDPRRATAPATSPFTHERSNPPRRRARWPMVFGALLGLAVVVGWWLIRDFDLSTGTELSSAVRTDDVRTTKAPTDDLVQFIARSLENNLITSSANPLFEPDERRELVTQALTGLQDPTVRQQVYNQHQTLAAEMTERGLGKEAWYDHIAVCEKVCHAAFSAVTARHVAKVSQLVHNVIFFTTGSSQLDSASRRDVRHVVDLLSNRLYSGQRILLIGRASRLGAHGYNMALSERRVHAVRDELLRWGVEPERIKTFWLGWEPPDLTRHIAQLYRIPGYLFDDDEVKLNQSVEMVLY